jgi:hypothetical protein
MGEKPSSTQLGTKFKIGNLRMRGDHGMTSRKWTSKEDLVRMVPLFGSDPNQSGLSAVPGSAKAESGIITAKPRSSQAQRNVKHGMSAAEIEGRVAKVNAFLAKLGWRLERVK